jgi:superfamily II DNA/RNA helicase
VTSFDDFGLADPIRRALAEENYTTPTPIQAQTIPIAITGKDVVGIAQTGTGKTAAFAIPILHRLAANRIPLQKKSCRVLVLSPTRELSAQILDSFQAYGRHLHIASTLAIGGVSMGGQVRALMNGVDILVATPGRLLDLVQSNALRLQHVEFLVLDEADRMLDMGFINDIRKIVGKLPKDRQTLFFSATMPQAITSLANDMLRDPARVSVTPQATTAERVTQRLIHLDKAAKPAVLAELLKAEKIDRALVFTRTKHGADKVVRVLAKCGIRSEAIHGNKSQNQRIRALDAFRDGEIRTLIATDIAARGIDVDGVSHVFNYDLPNVPESYVHRIGRTARAGADGIAISFCDSEERAFLRDIEKIIRQKIPAEDRRAQKIALPEVDAAQQVQPRRQEGERPQREPREHRNSGGGRGRNNPRSRKLHPAYGQGEGRSEGRGEGRGQRQETGRDQNQGRNRDHAPAQAGRGHGRSQDASGGQQIKPHGHAPAHRAEPHRQNRQEQQARPDHQGRPENKARPTRSDRPNRAQEWSGGTADNLSGVAFMQRTGQKRRNNRPQRPAN